jgi:ABC-type antimicrobial peptide transport system permease subunit
VRIPSAALAADAPGAFDVDPAEPFVYVALSVTLLLLAECGSFFPARRATRIDPVIALRTE